jgi:hypothetical protein
MPAPLNPNLWPSVLHDENGIPIGPLNPLPVTGGGGGGGAANRPAFVTGQVNVPVPGTAAQLPAQAIPDGFTIFIRAKVTNTGNIYIGNSAPNAQNHLVAFILEPGAFLEYGITNGDLVFLDADDANDGVMWTSEV